MPIAQIPFPGRQTECAQICFNEAVVCQRKLRNGFISIRASLLIVAFSLSLASCNADGPGSGGANAATETHGTAAVRLKKGSLATIAEPHAGRTYVPVYSSLHWGLENVLVDMTATLSVRNVSLKQPVILEAVRYYDSAGALVREYLPEISELPPMASVEFVIQRRDRTGGPGANFIVDWTVPGQTEPPFMEAVMVGQHGSAGLSFASPGRVVRRD